MSQADLGFMAPLFDLATSLTDDDAVENMSMGLAEPHADSALAADDDNMDGLWVSGVVITSITAAVDHVITLRDLVTRERGTITVNAPWTLLRGSVEAAGVGLWVVAPGRRVTRRARALRVWQHDFSERQKWEKETQRAVPHEGRSGTEWLGEIQAVVKRHGITPTQVVTQLSYGETVANAATEVGWERSEAFARWREASAFAHGRFWPQLMLTEPRSAEPLRGGYGMALTVNEATLAPMVGLAHDLLEGALLRYAELAAPDSSEG